MPLAVLIFNLPAEQEEYDEMTHACDVRAAWGDVWTKVRSKLKYEEISDEQATAYEQVRAWFAEACDEYGVEVP